MYNNCKNMCIFVKWSITHKHISKTKLPINEKEITKQIWFTNTSKKITRSFKEFYLPWIKNINQKNDFKRKGNEKETDQNI